MATRIILFLILLPSLLFSQEIRSLRFDELQKETLVSGDTLLILNFWATWCKPCIDELPYFENINLEYSKEKVKVILVNLDFNSKVNNVTLPFIQRNKLTSLVYHLSDTDPNEWINKVDSNWSGAIPATAMYLGGEKIYFLEGQIKKQELVWEVEKLLEEKAKNEISK